MEARWEPRFDFYMARIEDAPASFVLDMEAANEGPLESHTLRLQVRFKLRAPREDGLRDPSELEAMGALEDAIVERLSQSIDAIYVGRFVASGYTTFVFYVPESEGPRTADLEPLLGDTGEYVPEWLTEDDPTWDFYASFLYPDPYSLQFMSNRALVQELEEHGDQLEVPRAIDHTATFATREQAEAAAEALRGAGFETDPVEEAEPSEDDEVDEDDDEEPLFSVTFHRADALDGPRPDHLVVEILELLEPHEGEYDGWGTVVVKAT